MNKKQLKGKQAVHSGKRKSFPLPYKIMGAGLVIVLVIFLFYITILKKRSLKRNTSLKKKENYYFLIH
jgi:hypothetical protein